MADIFKATYTAEGAEYLYLKPFDDRFKLNTFFTTKNGGVSEDIFSSLNMALAYNSGDNPASLAENRRRVFSACSHKNFSVSIPHQVHGDNIQFISRELMSLSCDEKKKLDCFYGKCKNYTEPKETRESGHCNLVFEDTDAVITNVENMVLTSLHADCIPVWLYDPAHHAAGLAHAGWKGTRLDIAAKTVKKMKECLGTDPADVIAAVGPGIDICHFEVGAEVYEEFRNMLGDGILHKVKRRELGPYLAAELPNDSGNAKRAAEFRDYCRQKEILAIDDENGKFHLDLKGINRALLERAGLREIYVSDLCTVCRDDLFYSYRRDGGQTGRMCAGICLMTDDETKLIDICEW